MSKHTPWKISIKFKWAPKHDTTWWVDSTNGHRSHSLIGLNLIDVNKNGVHLGQELHIVLMRLRISLATRFSTEALRSSI